MEVRIRVEAALPVDARACLNLILESSPIDAEHWLQVPALRQTFVALAVLARRDELLRSGMKPEDALATAALRLGIPEATAVTWLRRWRSAA